MRKVLRSVRIEGDICIVPLSQGKEAICDVGDYDFVSAHNWFAHKGGRSFYARTKIRLGPNSRVDCKMHRLLLGLVDPKIEVDHKDGNGLNNRRSNIRPCVKSENLRNLSLYQRSSSGLKGVSWHKPSQKWLVQIQVLNRKRHVGLFNSKEAAAQAYNEASKKYHGAFGKQNMGVGVG